MSTATTLPSEPTPKTKARMFGLAGIIIAFLGLAGAIFAPLAFEVQQRPRKELSDVLADTALKIKDKVIKKEAPPPVAPQTNWRVVAIIIASGLGFVGAALGTISWVRREDMRFSGAAVAVGITAIAFHYIIAAIGVVIACIIIGWILSLLG